MCGFMGGYNISFNKYETRDQEKQKKKKNVILQLFAGSYLVDKQGLNPLCILFRSD